MNGKGDKRRHGKGFDEGYDRIFGKDHSASTSRTFVDSRTKKLVEVVEREAGGGLLVFEDIKPFVSPVTGKVISSRSALRDHNKQHGITDSRDYSPEFMEKKQQERAARYFGQTKEDKQHRIESLIRAVDMDKRRR